MGRILATIAALVFAGVVPSIVWAQADLREPAGKERLTIGGDWHNTRQGRNGVLYKILNLCRFLE